MRLMVGVLKSVGTGDLTVSDGLIFLSFGFSLFYLCWRVLFLVLYVAIRMSLIGLLKIAVERILDAKTVTVASPMAPGCGLYLGNVKYDLPWSFLSIQL